MSPRSLLTFSALLASSAAASPTIDPQYGDHAVIQRSKPIHLSGSAAPGERLKIRFAGQTRSAVANRAGRWQADFPGIAAAGGSLNVDVTGKGNASATDLTVGDVWLCSGQSNMEYPLRRALNGDGEVQSATDGDIRLLKIQKQLSEVPNDAFGKSSGWQQSTPESAADFSAACYFMVRDLRKTQKVPIGAIDDSWGGTPIRAWMDEAAARASGSEGPASQLELYRRDPSAALAKFGDQWKNWWRSQTGDPVGKEPWSASGHVAWMVMPPIGNWNNWGGDWPSFDGAIWARHKITLTAAEAAQPATLSLGVIDDIDQTFVNGVVVGGSSDPSLPREYKITPGVLRAGENDIVIYVRDLWGPGGMMGPADQLQLALAGGQVKPLGTGWEYARIADAVGGPPVPPWGNSSGVSTIYNAMVAPLGPIGLKGVAWYQGEADVGQPGYDIRLAAWMKSWRGQFRDPQLPFFIVGLAGWGDPSAKPKESGWASLINEQRVAVGRDARSALISAIDLGNPRDIHPADKLEVGRRLALAAETVAYGSAGKVGPLPVSAARSTTGVVVTFSKPLQALSSAKALAFELCGPTGGSCRFADARVRGNAVEIASDGQPVSRIRYAWGEYPIVNLYDEDMMPAPVFELPVN